MNKEKVNVIVGRFQPFTLGHAKGAEYVFDKYKLRTLFCIIDTPTSKLDKKHPFPSDIIIKDNESCKAEWFAGMYPIKNADISKITTVCREHNFEPVMWTCGTDRYESYRKQAIPKYMDALELSSEFKVIEIPRTDDDISATKVRNSIKDDDKSTFDKMMPSWSKDNFEEYKKYVKESKDTSLYGYINERIGGAVKNPKFLRLMKNAGLEGIELVKGDGYYYISSNDEKWDIIYSLPETDIYLNSFSQQSPEQWVEDIQSLLKNSK